MFALVLLDGTGCRWPVRIDSRLAAERASVAFVGAAANVSVAPVAPDRVALATACAAPPPLAEGQVLKVNSCFFVPLPLAGGGLLLASAESLGRAFRPCRRLAGGCVLAPSFSPVAPVSVFVRPENLPWMADAS